MMGAHANRYLCQMIGASPAFVGGTLRLNKKYNGPILNVYDGTTTKDVWSVNEIPAFGGSNNVFVATVYDQSGNTRDYTQSTTTKRPKIYDGGTTSLLRSNTRGPIVMRFDGTDDFVSRSDNLGMSSSSDFTYFQLCKVNSIAGNSGYAGFGTTASTGTSVSFQFIPNISGTGRNVPRIVVNGAADVYFNDSSFVGTLSQQYHYDVVAITHATNIGSGGSDWRLNGTSLENNVTLNGAHSMNNLGSSYSNIEPTGARFLNGDMSVFGLWTPQLSTADRSMLEKWAEVWRLQ